MTLQSERQPLGEFLSMEAVGSLVEKRLFGGYQVRYFPFLYTAGCWVFLKGLVLGYSLRNNIKVVARLLTEEGGEENMVQGLGEIAEKMVEKYGSLPEQLTDFYLKAAANVEIDHLDLNNLKQLYNRKERLGKMLPLLTMWCWEGVGFGVTYPDHVEQIWKGNFEITDQERWQRARDAGVDLTEVPNVLPLAEMKDIVLEETRQYAHMYFPELVEALS